ncbi:CGNR zinc finger domain-containing protein [Nocardia farcinica]|uniref:CGNR zinc finger domain-containing protein n=1 Tax=Nocardia farcinica TaxID=37329 RepID=UPI001892EB99|nr:CGNR zinc finger domain-containing protein [Nocardia farcinica]MBF6575678.1 CGNR zinc finger domain-containing protein [Nocardia farcinica]
MQFNPYGGMAAALAARLVNAGTDEDLGAVLAEMDYRPVGPVAPEQEAELRSWIGELAAVFADPTVERLNALLAATASKPHISTHDGRSPHLHYAEVTAPVDERVKAYTAVGLAVLFCEAPDRIGTCARAGCSAVFVDTSRNGRRRYCSTRCATRVHVAEHRRRTA